MHWWMDIIFIEVWRRTPIDLNWLKAEKLNLEEEGLELTRISQSAINLGSVNNPLGGSLSAIETR